MKGGEAHRGRRAAAAAMVIGLVFGAAGGSAQEVHTDLPLGLSLSQVLLASGLPLDTADPEGWSRQSGGGGGGGPAASPVHYSSVESSVRVPGVSADSVRMALEATVRSELAERGVQIMERPPRPGMPGAAGPTGATGNQGDAWTFPWRAPESGARGWVTLLVLPDAGERVRVLATSVEVRGGG